MAKNGRRTLGKLFARTQRNIVGDVMRSAAQCDTWLTLDELAKLTRFPPASISAQLRHLRKPRNGGYVVEKQKRTAGDRPRDEGHGPVWEYKISGRRRVEKRRAPSHGLRFAAHCSSRASFI
ncbi:MAG TPA: hypothetical protein VLX32_14265 [Candidatus Acidoferrum sp.]|nr:hypothetical protein [Candidatus Acidoferrum sp.]